MGWKFWLCVVAAVLLIAGFATVIQSCMEEEVFYAGEEKEEETHL